jgi:TonB-dependent starch-binding outer membrane protein SusC
MRSPLVRACFSAMALSLGLGTTVFAHEIGSVRVNPSAPPPPTVVAIDLCVAQPRQGTISGRVVDAATGEPLAGVSVSVVDTRLGSLTNASGAYTITGVPAGTHQVRAQRVGYAADLQLVTVAADQSATVNFRLEAAAIALQEIVVVGYGTQRRRDVTGAISSVDVTEIPTVATSTSVGQLLQGRVSGAQVVQNNGAPGAGISIRIRGTNSITANSEPLYVIDGMPAFVGSGSQDPYQNPLAAISPLDIESIEVLKDASATAIYGSRGASGVVLITTRQGRRGENRVTLESSAGIQSPARRLDLLNARQFAELANESLINVGLDAAYSEAEVQSFGEGTDWQDLVLRTAAAQSHNLTVSGGTERTRYLVSGSYLGQDGVMLGSQFERYSARVNLDQTVSSRLRLGTTLSVSSVESDLQLTDRALVSGAVTGAIMFNPVSPVRDPDTGAYVMTSPVTYPVLNPVALGRDVLNQRTRFALVGNVFGEYEFNEMLRLRTSFGTTSLFSRNRFFAPRTTPIGEGENGTGNQFSGTSLDLTNENILSYRRPVRGTDNLDVVAGFTVQTGRDEGVSAANSQFANDATGVYNLSAGTLPSANSSFSEWGLLSYLARANYSLLDRYLVTVTGRYDGSSRFGDNRKWALFPSAAVAWRLVQEPFMRNQRLFNDLKLRLGYGITGNQEIGLYQSLARLAIDNYSLSRATVIGYAPAGAAPNPNLKWETTRQFNAGVDLGLFDSRITASVEAYRSVTDDLLLRVNLPSTSGYDTQLQNIGSVANNGVELSLSTLNLDRPGIGWRSRLTLAANRNRVLDLGVADEIIAPHGGINAGNAVLIRVGHPTGLFAGYRTDGIFQEGDECTLTFRRQDLDCVPGEYRYVDINEDGRINADDWTILGHGHPDFYGGLTNDFRFGPVDLSVFLQGSYGGEVLNGPAVYLRRVNPQSNQTAEALDRWTPTNTDTDIPRANAARPREMYDTFVEDGSYLRLQSVTLGYVLPGGLIPAASHARLYVAGENLRVWSRYTGYDPEVNSMGGGISRGVDLGAYPRARTWNVGMEVTF